MKKIFLLALGLAIAFSFWGVHSIWSNVETVPVTIAQPGGVPSATQVEPRVPVTRLGAQIATVAPTLASFPTFTPVVVERTDATRPNVTAVAAESVTKAATRTVEESLLDQFIQSVTGQRTGLVTGVYVPGRFSLPVVQQPAGDDSFVSTQEVSATQFRSAEPYGTIGLLAHNYLSGKKYFDLRLGDEVVIVYGNGNHEHYQISEMERYQALSPTSPFSDFIDLSDQQQAKLSAVAVFQRIYTAKNRVVFQTCIEANGDASWGRIFVIADKVTP